MTKWLIPVKETKMSEETKEIKKMKMEAMRMLVKNHIFKGERGNVKHLGELDLDKADNVRLIISLQDLTENILSRKRKAEAQIAHLQKVVAAYAGGVSEYGGDLVRTRHMVNGLKSQLEARDKQIAGLEMELIKSNRQLSVFKEMFIDNSQNQKSANIPIKAETPATKAHSDTHDLWFTKFPGVEEMDRINRRGGL